MGVSLSRAPRAQQIDSPCLLPFSTDRLGVRALSQHNLSCSYPQSLTLIGGQLPKKRGKKAWIIAQRREPLMLPKFTALYFQNQVHPPPINCVLGSWLLQLCVTKVGAFGRREKDCWSWPSFLVWSETCTPLPFPPPKPKPLLLQAERGSVWSEVSSSPHRQALSTAYMERLRAHSCGRYDSVDVVWLLHQLWDGCLSGG